MGKGEAEVRRVEGRGNGQEARRWKLVGEEGRRRAVE